VQIFINPAAEVPIYRQIMRQIIEAVAGGKLKSGDKLPSHRDLSEEIVVAPLTVKKAYDELESLGYIETQRGRGTFVCASLPEVDRADQLERVREAARSLLVRTYLAGLQFPDAVKALKEADHELAADHSPLHQKEKI
jgi:GntR family transcriptional regulator